MERGARGGGRGEGGGGGGEHTVDLKFISYYYHELLT